MARFKCKHIPLADCLLLLIGKSFIFPKVYGLRRMLDLKCQILGAINDLLTSFTPQASNTHDPIERKKTKGKKTKTKKTKQKKQKKTHTQKQLHEFSLFLTHFQQTLLMAHNQYKILLKVL